MNSKDLGNLYGRATFLKGGKGQHLIKVLVGPGYGEEEFLGGGPRDEAGRKLTLGCDPRRKHKTGAQGGFRA